MFIANNKHFTVPYYLVVTTGFIDATVTWDTEVINIFSIEAQVPTYQNHLKRIYGATGGWVGNLFIVCGGDVFSTKSSTKDCYQIGKEFTSFHGFMKKKRLNAASIVLDESLWILGGSGDSNSMTTTEYISAHNGSSRDGPYMPYGVNGRPIGLWGHAAIKINSTTSMLIGGTEKVGTSYSYIAKCWFYSHLTGQWINGPDLLQARTGHTAGLLTDSVSQESFVVVSGGRETNNMGFDSVEILNLKEGTKWISGKL